MSGALRVGLIGAGWVTQYHLQAWQKLAGRADIVAIADPSVENVATRADAFGIDKRFSGAQAMLDGCQLDAVDIAAPRAVHAELVRLVADRGIPVICQKPLAPTLVEAEILARDVEGRIRLMVHENWRFRDYYRDAAGWIRDGRIGEITAARLMLVTSGTIKDSNGQYPALVRQPLMRNETRMLVAEVLIHHLDTLRMLLGPLDVTAATLTQTCTEIAGEDGAVIQLQSQGGAGVSLFATFAAHGAPPAQSDRLDILGKDGAIRLEGNELQLFGAQPETRSYDLAASYQGSYDATIAHFVEALASGAPFETSPKDNLQTLRLVEDCYRLSGRDNRP
ncbi:MAG: oxidoreductase [Tardiphaga sp.]|uniref:Gfo/Idh/MocA family protein n=1 Tax=Tardiphaga sp. TaxID=1926292 RepID=UPI0026235103|nr:Gfo/Idh/MocA family oxidoreductase [Tardiphaga sp.]MDB5504047.1 oxidoreductase [Tardiphaga sp.]